MSNAVARHLAELPLTPPEITILLRYKQFFENRRVLDLGVGSGRITRYLLSFCADYLGIDLSPQMLAYARELYPEARLSLGDFRDLAQLSEDPFDFIFIAFNTIDVLRHEDRLKLLADVRRLMSPDGVFVFSTHNRSWRHCGKRPVFPAYSEVGNLPRYLNRLLRTGREIFNHNRLAHLQQFADDHAIVTGSHMRTGLVYCIDRKAQLEQLKKADFEVLSVYDIDGREVGETDMSPESYNLHFVCRLPAEES
ncbi:class I SAM-dependent methyltransferase [Roseibium sp.]|uniref:class I SAM-dependent methyltransferase n=1 Tax=Roseibium sp. TaxID=1936156 RepID=UPI003D0CA968